MHLKAKASRLLTQIDVRGYWVRPLSRGPQLFNITNSEFADGAAERYYCMVSELHHGQGAAWANAESP